MDDFDWLHPGVWIVDHGNPLLDGKGRKSRSTSCEYFSPLRRVHSFPARHCASSGRAGSARTASSAGSAGRAGNSGSAATASRAGGGILMTLNTLWFIFIGILYTGFFVLEGFDFGVGILLPFLGKNDLQRRTIINTIGPHWDGNEVWLITAGGATFAAFPNWYATLFSGFYLPLFLVLIGLIVRGVAFEFRSKDDHPLWRSFWDWCLCLGSIIPTILFPVAFSNLVRGIPIDANLQSFGGFFYLLNPFPLLASFLFTLLIIMHGASFLSLKTTGEIEQKARALVRWVWLLWGL